jgi:hypothetical protein
MFIFLLESLVKLSSRFYPQMKFSGFHGDCSRVPGKFTEFSEEPSGVLEALSEVPANPSELPEISSKVSEMLSEHSENLC